MILRRSKRLGIEKWFCRTSLILLKHSWSIWTWSFIINERWWSRIFQVFKIASRQILICHQWRALIHVETIILQLYVQKLVIAILLHLLTRHTCCIVSHWSDIYIYFFGHLHGFGSLSTKVILNKLSRINFSRVLIMNTTELVFHAQFDHDPTVFGVLFAIFLIITIISDHFVRELSRPHISAASLNNINFSHSLFRSHFRDVEVSKVARIVLCFTQSLHLETISLSFSFFAKNLFQWGRSNNRGGFCFSRCRVNRLR